MSASGTEILLVEDNPHDVQLTLRAFEKHKLVNRVHVVRDGAEALEFLFASGRYADRRGEKPPRLVLLDLKLPLVDGLEVLRQLKDDVRTRSIPVVVLTSSREDADLRRSYSLGVNSYVVKPVSFERFLDAARQLGMYWLLLNEAPVL